MDDKEIHYKNYNLIIKLNCTKNKTKDVIKAMLMDIGVKESDVVINTLFDKTKNDFSLSDYMIINMVLLNLTSVNYQDSNVDDILAKKFREWLIDKYWESNPEYANNPLFRFDFGNQVKEMVDELLNGNNLYSPTHITLDEWRDILLDVVSNNF